jgi:hypothetical protein
LVDQPNLHGANFAQIYSTWLYFHDGLGFDLVPGYMQLEADYGQFTALERLYKLYEQSGRCSDAERTWNSLRVAMHGGSLEYTEPAPVCKSIPQSE